MEFCAHGGKFRAQLAVATCLANASTAIYWPACTHLVEGRHAKGRGVAYYEGLRTITQIAGLPNCWAFKVFC